jgi:hypothetical protein
MSKGIPKVTKKRKDKIPITFNGEQLDLIEKYTGVMGNTKAEIIRNIVINWLLDREVGRK